MIPTNSPCQNIVCVLCVVGKPFTFFTSKNKRSKYCVRHCIFRENINLYELNIHIQTYTHFYGLRLKYTKIFQCIITKSVLGKEVYKSALIRFVLVAYSFLKTEIENTLVWCTYYIATMCTYTHFLK